MEKQRKPSGKNSTPKRDSWKPSEGLQKPLTRGMFQKIGTKRDHEETSVKHEEVIKSIKNKLLIYKTPSKIELDQVEKTIICIKSGGKQRHRARKQRWHETPKPEEMINQTKEA